MTGTNTKRRLPARDMWGYASGEGVNSVAINGISNFALLFYTQVMGMSPELAGLALTLAFAWDAISDPIMGSVTDRTRSRFGRRHPYMVAGGLVFVLSFAALWLVPDSVRGESALFVYLLIMNIVAKTAFTVFVVPYTALGFEMCEDYEEQTRLQGIRYGFNMIVNIITGGFAWVLFFPDHTAADGSVIDGSKVEANYQTMGIVVAIIVAVLIAYCVVATYKYAQPALAPADPPGDRQPSSIRAFMQDVADVWSDRLVWFVFGFFGLAQFSMLIVSQVQMFTYVEYMQFSAAEKTFVHTGGMVAFALGALLLARAVRRLDKKKTSYAAMGLASCGGVGLYVVFIGGFLQPQAESNGLPVAVVVFALLQMLWWGGCGVILPLATSMIADIAEMKKRQQGGATEGRYAAGFSFFLKAAISLGLLATGYILKFIGYDSGATEQSDAVIHNLAATTFLIGPVLMAFSFAVLRKYPVTQESVDKVRTQSSSLEA